MSVLPLLQSKYPTLLLIVAHPGSAVVHSTSTLMPIVLSHYLLSTSPIAILKTLLILQTEAQFTSNQISPINQPPPSKTATLLAVMHLLRRRPMAAQCASSFSVMALLVAVHLQIAIVLQTIQKLAVLRMHLGVVTSVTVTSLTAA